MRKTHILFFIVLILFELHHAMAQTTYYYDGSGNMNSTGNWWTNTNGTGSNPANFTANNQVFEIRNTTALTVSYNWTVSGTGSKIVLGNTSVAAITMSHSSGDINGILDIAQASSGTNTYSVSVSNVNRIPDMGTLHSSSLVNYSRGGNMDVVTGAYGNLTMSGSGSRTALANFSVAGALTINSGLTLDMQTFQLTSVGTVSGTGTLRTQNTSATPLPSGKTWTCTIEYNSGSAQTMVSGTYVDLNGTGGNRTLASSGTIAISGTFTTGAGTYTVTGSTLDFNGTTQNVPAFTFNNLTCSNSGTKTATGALTVNAVLTIATGVILNMQTNTLSGITSTSGTGTLQTQNTSASPIPSGDTYTFAVQYNSASAQTMVNANYGDLNGTGGNRTLSSSGTIGISGTFTAGAGTYTVTSSTVDFNGTNQNIPTFTFNNLTCSNSGTKTATGNLTVNTTLNIASGVVLNMQTNTLSGVTSTSGSGTLQTQSTAVTPIPAGDSYAFTVQYNSASSQNIVNATYTSLNASGGNRVLPNGSTVFISSVFTPGSGTYTNTGSTIDYNGTGAQTIAALTYNNLTISAARTTSTVTLVNGGTISVAGTFTASATFTSGGYAVTGNTFDFNGGAQNIPAFTFNNLTCSGSGDKSATGNLTVNGTLTINSGRILNMQTNVLTGVANTSGVGTLQTQNTSASPIPSGVTWTFAVQYNSASAQTIVNGSYVDLNGSGGNRTLSSSGTISISGTFTIGSGTYTTTSSTVSFNGTTQTVPALTYNNLTIATTGEKTMASGFTVSGILALTNGILTIGSSNTLTLNGTVSTTSGTIKAGTCGASPFPNISIGGTGALGTINLESGFRTLNNLTINRTSSGTVTIGSNMNIGGTLTLTNGALVTDNRLAFHTSNSPITRTSGTITLTANAVLIFGNCDQAGTAFTLPNNLFTAAPTITELWIDRTNGVTLGNQMISISSVLTITNNATLTTNSNISLLSDATATARIAALSGTASISGNVTVQRFISSQGRRWRFLSSPVTSTTLEDWRGEIFITGNNLPTANQSNVVGNQNWGFDATQNNQPTVYTYTESTVGAASVGWVDVKNSTSSLTAVSLTPARGYRVFVRGDRSSNNRLNGTDNTQNAVTLTSVGTPNQGNRTASITYTNTGSAADDGWNLIGNPYASPYDWNAHWDAGNSGGNSGTNYTNVGNTAYIWDPTANSYKSYNASSNSGTLTNGIIPSGASFFIQTTGASPAFTFVEANKSTSVPITLFKQSNSLNELHIRFTLDSNDYDEYILNFDRQAISKYDKYDIMKLTNASLNLASITADSYSLTLDSRPIIAATDTVKLSVNAICGNYSLDFNQVPQLQGKAILLKDNYLSKVVMIIAGFSYPFTIHLSDSATYGDNRFQLIIVNQSQVPVSLVYFDATKKDATTNLITWATAYERQSDYFELQRSFNGFDYDLVAILKAKGNSLDLNEYKYDDEPLLMNENMPIYYRLKMVDLDGTFTYADAVILKPSKNNPSSDGLFSISPNPATDHILLKCNANEQQTIVMMQIADLQGRILEQYEGYKERINVSLIKTGIYHLVILKQNGLKETLRFIKN